ncbi:MAG: carboxypeptidase-like regulatory domain-containing protein [Anaerolineales bacterium]|jgi:hypothetical protein
MSKSIKCKLNLFFCFIFLFCKPYSIRAQEIETILRIEYPYEGETIYAGPSTPRYNLPISGWLNLGKYSHEDVELHLEIFREGLLTGSTTTKPSTNGQFIFYTLVNPLSSEFVLPLGGQCGENCHYPTNVEVDLSLPSGKVLLKVTAFVNGKLMGLAERNIIVDRSNLVSIPIEIHFIGDTKVVNGIRISGSTRLYLWRARHFSTVSGSDGKALIEVESLSEGPTHYLIKIEPTVINGLLYEGVEPVELILPPGATSIPPVKMEVKSRTGQIKGILVSKQATGIKPTDITAIHLPDGSSHKTKTSEDGTFSFTELPIARYLVTVDNSILIKNGLYVVEQEVDLTKDIQVNIQLPISSYNGGLLQGAILNEHGIRLPFAWITPKDTPITQRVLPDTGMYMLYDLPLKPITLLVSAPGYYSQAKVVEMLTGSISYLDVRLVRQQETQSIPWGDGELLIPTETKAEIRDQSIALKYGWLWGEAKDTQPLVIHTDSAEVIILNGKFGLEVLPKQSEWLYVFDGKVEVRLQNDSRKIILQTNQMVNLMNDEGLKPVPYDPIVLMALRQGDEIPITLSREPTLEAQIRDRLARIGIGSAQLITLFTYFIGFLSLVLTPVVAIYWWWKYKESSQ